MKKIEYQVLRYLPDQVSGEFVNLGVIAFDPEGKVLEGKFINKIGNISTLFPSLNSWYLIRLVKTIQSETRKVAAQLVAEFSFIQHSSIQTITQNILPVDDSALVFSPVKKTLDLNVKAVVVDLFARFVKSHLVEEDDELRRDKEVWQKVYKKHFDQQGITSHFRSHKVKTKNDEMEFERAWKNGSWNCLETVSFNLSRIDSIKNKVYKWVGKLDELNSSKESLNIYLLSVLPHDHPELAGFITKKINAKSTVNAKVHVVSEEEIDKIARKLKREIESH